MNRNTQNDSIDRRETLSLKAINLLNSPIFVGVITSIVALYVEYKSGLFQASQGNTNYSISPLWSAVAAFFTAALFTSIIRLIQIAFSSQRYFREEFSFIVLSTIAWLATAIVISFSGQLMFWYPVVAAFYVVSNQKLSIPQPTWEGYAFLIVLIILIYLLGRIGHQSWDGLKSVQQHQRDQRSEFSGMLPEGIGELKRIVKREGVLEKYSEPDASQLLSHLEQAEDFISQAWEEQARELLRLSSSSYAIAHENAWHDREGYWVGQNIDTGNLILLYPTQIALSKQELDDFLDYSKRVAESRNCQIDELIVAFRDNKDKLATPTDFYKKVRFETEEDLLEGLVNFTDYYNDIRKRVQHHTLPESDLTLHDVYVRSHFLASQKSKSIENVEQYLRKWIDEPSQRQIALLGEYGQGKSSTALMFTYHLLCGNEQLSKRIPILIELRGKSPRDLRPLELLGAWASQYRIEPQALMRLHIAGRLILIFEGFDEMALMGNSELRLKHFRSLWKFCYPNVKIIITGRPNFFLDDMEMKAALGIIKPLSAEPYCEAIRLAPFTVNQIREALRRQKLLVRDQICSLAQNEARFLEIVSRPSLLHVVSTIWEKEKLHEKAELLNSAYVMECFVRSSYRRQGLKAIDSGDFMALNSSERDYFMCGVASYMAAEQLSNQISNEQLNDLVDSLIEVIPTSVSTFSPEIRDEDTRPLGSRIHDPNDMEHVRTDVRTCGLLVDDPSAPGTFKFAHKSFMEYLFATTVKEYIWDPDSEKARAIKKVTYFPIEAILDLSVSLGFLSEMIGTDNDTKQSSGSDLIRLKGERTTSIRLLNVILDSNSPFEFISSRFLLFCFSYLESGKSLNSIQRIFLRLGHPIGLLLLIGTSAVLFLPSSPNNLLENRIFLSTSTSAMLLMFLIISFNLSYTYLFTQSRRSSSPRIRKFRLWNSICKEIGISDIAMHLIVGTYLLPWARKQPFNYFLMLSKVSNDSSQ